ncbi:MAG: glycoside hydrolase family 9 protein [Saprospiraceae bacterium]
MKQFFIILNAVIIASSAAAQTDTWIRINQIGYLPNDVKVAVLCSKKADFNIINFEVYDVLTKKLVLKSNKIQSFGEWTAFKTTYRLDFSDIKTEGTYYIKTGAIYSPTIRISKDAYEGSADFILRYLRQQRCGFNSVLNDSCHTHGGYIVYGDSMSQKYHNLAPYPIFGGWHDASDYLQYVTTTATAVFQMLFAYEQNPGSFKDQHQANGLPGANGIPDVLDEVKWGLDWLVRMNPENNVFFNQVCDDRDHRGMRMPNKDTLTYDIKGSGARPVYRITGEPQGLGKYKNRTTGVSSSVAKFASAFAAGARHLAKYDANYANMIYHKAVNAYHYALSDTGVCQTAPNRAPYFYEEENWYDDVELAAVQLAKFDPDNQYFSDAVRYGKMEAHSHWMGKDTATHYQWFPFINYGHIELLAQNNDINTKYFPQIIKADLQKLADRGAKNAFNIGIPFIWCSNNYISAAASQARLYEQKTGDTQFRAMQTALRDWLFGCNPWGTSMIIGLPNAQIGANPNGDFPEDPHAAFTHYGKIQIDGGLVDGPLYASIFGRLIGLTLYAPDEYQDFQSNYIVYHDDYGDYSTNEPTMDGSASLTYLLADLESEGKVNKVLKDAYGATYRHDTTQQTIYLVFTGHEFAEGSNIIIKILQQHDIKASFFFTGDFLRQQPKVVRRLKQAKHYIGAHSDKHLLYADWNKRDSTLISKTQFINDLEANYNELAKYNIQREEALYFMPPYEWYNDSIVLWTRQAGLQLIQFTPGTGSNADYTTPDMKNYKSSAQIYNQIVQYEQTDPQGLNGFILLLHIGAGEQRTDKFYTRLNDLIKALKQRGYTFSRL